MAHQCEIWIGDEESQCRSRDQNGNFCKINMADGRHFENSFISISQPSQLSDFDQIWYTGANFHFEDDHLQTRNSAVAGKPRGAFVQMQ